MKLNSFSTLVVALATCAAYSQVQNYQTKTNSNAATAYAECGPFKKTSDSNSDNKSYSVGSGWVIESFSFSGGTHKRTAGPNATYTHWTCPAAEVAALNMAYQSAIVSVINAGLGAQLQNFIVYALTSAQQSDMNYITRCQSGYIDVSFTVTAYGNGKLNNSKSWIRQTLQTNEISLPNWLLYGKMNERVKQINETTKLFIQTNRGVTAGTVKATSGMVALLEESKRLAESNARSKSKANRASTEGIRALIFGPKAPMVDPVSVLKSGSLPPSLDDSDL